MWSTMGGIKPSSRGWSENIYDRRCTEGGERMHPFELMNTMHEGVITGTE